MSSEYQKARGQKLVIKKMIRVVSVVPAIYQVQSLSNPKHSYIVSMSPMSCDCMAIKAGHMKSCSHIAGVRYYRKVDKK